MKVEDLRRANELTKQINRLDQELNLMQESKDGLSTYCLEMLSDAAKPVITEMIKGDLLAQKKALEKEFERL